MTIVTQNIESNVNLWVPEDMAIAISRVFEKMPFELYLCQEVADVFMIPHFILIIDGRIITKANNDIEIWECYLSDWSGKMEKCRRCRNQEDCIPKIIDNDLRVGPEFNPPTILLNRGKMQRDVEGLIAIIPPVPDIDHVSKELELWLHSITLTWHRRAQKWRKEFDSWNFLEELREDRRPKKASDMARTKWMPRKIEIKLPTPEF